jgi:hypothetical protein
MNKPTKTNTVNLRVQLWLFTVGAVSRAVPLDVFVRPPAD